MMVGIFIPGSHILVLLNTEVSELALLMIHNLAELDPLNLSSLIEDMAMVHSAERRAEDARCDFTGEADDFVELVWKNGQILMRGRSSSPSCISDSSHHSPKPQVKTSGGEIYTSKRRRLGTVNSLSDFDDCLPGRKELSKHKHSVQDNCHPDHLFPGFYENNLNIFLETTRNNNTYDEYLTESQIVPECKDENLRQLHEPSLQQCQFCSD
ncbi:hypothetical protein GH714_038088 [Hevea brasiliensis]|uniref:Uncharacterized protein n=1 Tax=Hevea brasiliensis TaxID=3981 RepID=A0A6A6LWS2_HEVBR|nr:hypothetical protein GH714_038088 [Hevea brasiliensis]